MQPITTIPVLVVAVIHVVIAIVEMFFWKKSISLSKPQYYNQRS